MIYELSNKKTEKVWSREKERVPLHYSFSCLDQRKPKKTKKREKACIKLSEKVRERNGKGK